VRRLRKSSFDFFMWVVFSHLTVLIISTLARLFECFFFFLRNSVTCLSVFRRFHAFLPSCPPQAFLTIGSALFFLAVPFFFFLHWKITLLPLCSSLIVMFNPLSLSFFSPSVIFWVLFGQFFWFFVPLQ